ncbi:MAG: hypothetical protein NT038_04990 [Euryarchaeota archaeon]|nr:hypothetical protein [Euryarchaeota archaeon]
MVITMTKTLIGIIACVLIVLPACSFTAMSANYRSNHAEENTRPHLDFLVQPQAIGWGLILWNYGKHPAVFVTYEIEMKKVGNTKVIGGNQKGIIPVLRTRDTLFIHPLNFPMVKMIYPFGYGEVEITVHVSCKNANYDVTQTKHWIINGFKLMPLADQD